MLAALPLSLILLAPAPPADLVRYVAIVDKSPEDPCPLPDAGGWIAERMFHRGELRRLIGADSKLPQNLKDPKNPNQPESDNPAWLALPRALERFCVYSPDARTSNTTLKRNSFNQAKRVLKIDRDRSVLVPQGPAADGIDDLAVASIGQNQLVQHDLAVAYQRSLAAQEAAPESGINAVYASNAALAATARVAVVDTMDAVLSATSHAFKLDKRRQWHGIAMDALIDDIRCPEQLLECRKRSFFVQAFPPADAADDRALGSVGTVATAITTAVMRWRRESGLGTPPPLVINLSLGWDAKEYGDFTPTTLGLQQLRDATDQTTLAPVQAAYLATLHASCHDVLTIAAAGNNTGGPCEQVDALAPARWERHHAPTRAQCVTLFGEAHLVSPRVDAGTLAATHRPLVYAAGGITARNLALPNARPDSTPPRVVPAMQAVASNGAEMTGAWSGTSVAAATVSGLAANLWSHATTLSPHQLMAIVDASGIGIPQLPNKLVPELGKTRRISAYLAFEELHARYPTIQNPYRKPLPPPTPVVPVQPKRGSPVAPVKTQLERLIADLPTLTEPSKTSCHSSQIQCGSHPMRLDRCWSAGTPSTLPVTPPPWVRPQPDTPICPLCPVKGGKLVLSLNPKTGVTSAVLSLLTLDLHSTAGGGILSFTLPDKIEVNQDTLVALPYLVTTTTTGGGTATMTLEQLLTIANNTYRTGVLSYFAVDAVSGKKLRMTSDITVSQ